MNNYLGPDHWVNGGESDSCDPIAKAFTELEEENKKLRAALERIVNGDFLQNGCSQVRMEAVQGIAREALNE